MERIDAQLRHELRRFDVAGSIAALVEAWPAAVGREVARNAWPGRVARDGTLHVATSSAAWAFELTQLAPTILEQLALHAGDAAPRALRFAPGPLPEPLLEERRRDVRSPAAPSPEIVEKAERIASAVGDEELRELVARAAAASLAKAADDRPF